MQFTDYQKEVLRAKGMCKVIYRKMWTSPKHELGYSTKGKGLYEITVASDTGDDNVKNIVLLHEVGHVFYGHLDQVDYKRELENVKSLFEKNNKPYSLIRTFGGPMGFLNVVMDLEINTKLLTLANSRYMQRKGYGICVPETFKIDTYNDFREYYEPVIQSLPNTDEEAEQMKQNIKDALSNSGSNGSNTGKGQSSNGNGVPVPDWMKELVDEVISDLSEEIKEEIEKEKANASKVSDDEGDIEEEGHVSDVVEDSDGEDSEDTSSSYGKFHSDDRDMEGFNYETEDVRIKAFLSNIIKTDLDYRQDAFRHHNRGTRQNSDGLLYNSLRRRVSTKRKKLAILVDISGSMDATNLLIALKSFEASASLLDPQSCLITWDESKCDEYPITQIPSYVGCGGGTDMASGLEYCIEKGFDDVVIFSDMETNIEPMFSLAKKVNVHTILVRKYRSVISDSLLESYLKLNTSVLRLGVK